MSNRRNRPQWGVSLIECCAALTITSVLASAGVSSFRDMIERRRLEGRSTELTTDLHYLRTEAVSQNQALRIRFQGGANGACYVLHRGDNCECSPTGTATCSGDAEAIKVVSLPQSQGIGLSSNVQSILIDPRLGTATPGGTVRLTDPQGRELRHIVSLMGRVRVCRAGATTTGHPTC